MRTYSMGRFIDELTDEQRDKLITATDFTNAAWWDTGCGCLCGTALGFESQLEGENWIAAERRRLERGYMISDWSVKHPAYRYPYAVHRFGKERIVRAIKARASTKLPTAFTAPVEQVPEMVAL